MKRQHQALAACFVIVLVLAFAPACLAQGQWASGGVKVADRPNPRGPMLAPDGSGGAIIAWSDWESETGNIFAQRIDSLGRLRWGINGIVVCNATERQSEPVIVSDGAGGAIVAWVDGRSGTNMNVYAQRLDPGGARKWAPNGVPVCTETHNQGMLDICTDGAHGAIISWQDQRIPTLAVFAQRIDAGGAVKWAPADGVGVKLTPVAEHNAHIVEDGSGGAVLCWWDESSGNDDIFAQRFNASGARQWSDSAKQVCTDPTNQAFPDLAPSGAGGCVVVWQDIRSAQSDVYAQRLDSSGTAKWTADGKRISPSSGEDSDVEIAPDGEDGAVISWRDRRTGEEDLYAQRVRAADGAGMWATGGVAVCTAADDQGEEHVLVGDGEGGAVLAWMDGRPAARGVYAQRLSPTGRARWEANGTMLRGVGTSESAGWFGAVPDGSGGAFLSWVSGPSEDRELFAQKLSDLHPAWYLAEGTTAWGFETYITIQNPNSTAVTADITYMLTGGATRTESVALPASSQTTLTNEHLETVLGEIDFSTRVACREGETIAVDRTISWTGAGASSPEAHSSVGVTAPSCEWFLPEGSSNWGFETWLCIQNPNAAAASCRVTYMTEDEQPREFTKTVPGNSRQSFNMADDVGGKDASIKVDADAPVIAERSMYRNGRREGHNSTGAVMPVLDSYLAEGTTAWGFTTYVLIQNPNAEEATVDITYMTPSGPEPQAQFLMGPDSRKTIRVNAVLPGTDFSTGIHGSLPIVAERAMYWDAGQGEACHDSIGIQAAHTRFYLPDGQTTDGRETWTLVQNPNPSDVVVEVTYMTPSGAGNVTFTETVPAGSRRTYSMAEPTRGLQGRASTMVTCKTTGKKVIVERAMYWSNRGAGTDTVGGCSD